MPAGGDQPQNPLRIAQAIQSVHARGGGTSTAFLQIFSALVERQDVRPHAYSDQIPGEDPAQPIIGRHRDLWTLAPGLGGVRPGALGRALTADIEAGRFDVVHLHGLWSSDLTAAALAAERRGVPVVWNPHGMLVGRAFRMKRLKKQIFLRMGLGKALRGASALVFASNVERDTSVVLPGTERIRREVIPLPVELPAGLPSVDQLRAEGRAKFGIAADEPVMVYLGRLHPVKRLDLALGALAQARRRVPKLRLLLLGSAELAKDEQDIRAAAARLGVSDAVIFGGWVDGLDKWRGVAAGDALTLQSMFENFGYVVLEAAALGLPVVMTENLSLASEAVEAMAGVSCSATPEALAVAWEEALSMARRGTVTRSGPAWVTRVFSPEAVGLKMSALYRELVSR